MDKETEEIIKNLILPELSIIDVLEQELEETFLTIVYSGKNNDVAFIKEKQNYFKNKYDVDTIKKLCSDKGATHIIPVYKSLQNLLKKHRTPEEIRMRAEKVLYTYLLPQQDNLDIELPCEMPCDLDEAIERQSRYGRY